MLLIFLNMVVVQELAHQYYNDEIQALETKIENSLAMLGLACAWIIFLLASVNKFYAKLRILCIAIFRSNS